MRTQSTLSSSLPVGLSNVSLNIFSIVMKVFANIYYNHYLEGKEESKVEEEEKGDLNDINKIIHPPQK